MIPVVWYDRPADGKGINRGYWDQGLLERFFAGLLWRTGLRFEHRNDFPTGGAVVVIPGRFHAADVHIINAELARLDWCVVIVSSDEEALFPHDAIRHPNCRAWTATPHPDRFSGDRVLGHYLPPQATDLIAGCEHEERPLDWFWSGQANHTRREALWKALRRLPGGEAHRTPGFTQGMPPADFYGRLCAAKVAPAPAGPATPDSFRLWEALEAGCVPVADVCSARVPNRGYWRLFGDVPFPTVDDWRELPDVLASTLADWSMLSVECSAWWQQHKRSLAKRLTADIIAVSGVVPERLVDDEVTVIVPTSPTPGHPSTDVIAETLTSIRAQLPVAQIVVTCDGVRPELEHRRSDYESYLRRLMWLCNHTPNVVPVVRRDHGHQGLTTRAALELVDTPLVLFVEHDTPLCGSIPWEGMAAAIHTGHANMIRLHHEASVLEPHRHLMLDSSPQIVAGVPMLRTVQWSQRPHLASTEFYRRLIHRYFGAESRTMIEDVMHGVVDNAWRRHGESGWDDWRLWLFAPEGDMKRSLHLDARGDDPKFDDRFVFAYDSDSVPEGAPYPTAWRV